MLSLLLTVFLTGPAAFAKPVQVVGGSEETRRSIIDPTVKITISLDPGSYIYCSGSFIAPNKIVTAGHCMKDGVSGITVNFRSQLYAQGSNITCTPKWVKLYPVPSDGDAILIMDDLAVLTIGETGCSFEGGVYDFSELAADIVPFSFSSAAAQKPHWLSGFGSTEHGSHDISVKVNTVSYDKFRQIETRDELESIVRRTNASNVPFLTDRLFAFIQSGKKSCYKVPEDGLPTPYFGDSGGPSYYIDADGRPVLVSLFSFMLLDDDRVMAFCNTNVSAYFDYIQQR